MRRRIVDYDPALGIQGGQMAVTIAGFVIAVAMAIFIFNLLDSAKRGEVAKANPWGSRSPEFQLPSPVPEHNYADQPFEVLGEPYDYGLADSVYTSLNSAPEPAATD